MATEKAGALEMNCDNVIDALLKFCCRVLKWHQWSLPLLLDDKSCIKTTICLNCGLNKGIHPDKYAHDWGEWEYKSDGLCLMTQHCLRCGLEVDEIARKMGHKWSDWSPEQNTGREERYCARCGKMDSRYAPVKATKSEETVGESYLDKPYDEDRCPECGRGGGSHYLSCGETQNFL